MSIHTVLKQQHNKKKICSNLFFLYRACTQNAVRMRPTNANCQWTRAKCVLLQHNIEHVIRTQPTILHIFTYVHTRLHRIIYIDIFNTIRLCLPGKQELYSTQSAGSPERSRTESVINIIGFVTTDNKFSTTTDLRVRVRAQ